MGTRSMPWFFFIVLFIVSFSFDTHISMATDTIYPGESLTGKQTLTSKSGNYALGFFSPGTSQRYYIGIRYNKISEQIVVWVANRETPLPDASSQLKVSEDGNLVLQNQLSIIIWSTNSSIRTSNSTVAVLLDNGNLVLKDGSNSSGVFWQSFDHPTDTFLPGGRLGLNKITGEKQILTSWRSSDDPAPGPFSLEMDLRGNNQFVSVWNQSERYWSSGEWNGHFFSGIPEMAQNYMYNVSFVDNIREKYFTYSVSDPSIISRLVMDVSGQQQQLTWMDQSNEWMLFYSQPRDQCEVYSVCGDFGFCNQKSLPFCTCLHGFEAASIIGWNLSDWPRGCVRKTPLRCGNSTTFNGEKDRFWIMRDIQLSSISPQPSTARSFDDCTSACLNDCSCTAYAYSNNGCSIWNGNLRNLVQVSGGDSNTGNLYLRLSASDVPVSTGKKKSTTKVIVSILFVVMVVVACISVTAILIRRYRRRKTRIELMHGSLIQFSYRDLQTATRNFAEKLGGGSFGSVYKGILPDSTATAVKKLEGLGQGEKQFRTEVSTIGTIQHVNLIHLRGFCSEGANRLLVYDFMPNGSLDFQLFGKSDNVLDWKTRYQIALGTARGLAYLHDECRDRIIHCDVKPENVLLDAKYCPRLSDFGMAKLFDRYRSRVLTTVRGTLGYLAPEWASGVAITTKADVYSYGMMLFEIISGRRNTRQVEDSAVDFFPIFAATKTNEGDVLCLLDERLDGSDDIEELERACRVACWCIQEDESCRPSMGQVVQALEGVLEVKACAVPKFLLQLAEHQGSFVFPGPTSSNKS